MTYLENLPAKIYNVRDGEVGFDFDSIGLKVVVEEIHEEPRAALPQQEGDVGLLPQCG
jgi:hypothetical protein